MDAHTRALLEAADDADGFEVPNNDWNSHPWGIMSSEVRSIQSEVLTRFGIKFERDGQVQDASFHDELRVLHPSSYRPNGVVAHIPEICIRFSNFGRLYTIFSATAALPKYPVHDIKAIVDRHGWMFVAPESLAEPYDGKNLQLRAAANLTWWIRYFDHI